MSLGLRLDLAVPCERFTVALAWETAESALGIFGASGAGKTTILEALAGLRAEASGRIEFGGEVWLDSERGIRRPPEARGVGYVPQEALLFPHLDVAGNVEVGRRRARASARGVRPERVLELLELGALARRPVGALSGGERQRVALARALCSGPEMLLLDEPLASLDLPLKRRILGHLLRIREEFAIPTLYVSHDASELTLLCREVAVLAAGKLVARGRPETVFTSPALLPMARREGYQNVLRGRVSAVAAASARVEIEPGLALTVAASELEVGARVAVGLGAEEVLLGVERPAGLSAQNVLAGAVTAIETTAADELEAGAVLVVAAIGAGALRLAVLVTPQAAAQLELAPGKPVFLIFKAQACRLLAAD